MVFIFLAYFTLYNGLQFHPYNDEKSLPPLTATSPCTFGKAEISRLILSY